MSTTREKLIDLLTEFYGVDPMYYGVDAHSLAEFLVTKGVTIKKPKKPKQKGISRKAMIALNLIGQQTHRGGEIE